MKWLIMTGLLAVMQPAAASEFMVVDRETATMAAAFLNKEKQAILFCGCCKDDEKRKVEINEAEVITYEERYSVRLHGIASDTAVVNEVVDLVNVYVKKGRMAIALGEILGKVYTTCTGPLLWRTMEEWNETGLSANTGKPDTGRMEYLVQNLSGLLTPGSSFTQDGTVYEIERISCTYDSLSRAIRLVLMTNTRSKLVYNLPVSSDLQAKTVTEYNRTYLILLYKNTDEEPAIWFTHFNFMGELISSGAAPELKIPLKQGVNGKKLAKTVKKLA